MTRITYNGHCKTIAAKHKNSRKLAMSLTRPIVRLLICLSIIGSSWQSVSAQNELGLAAGDDPMAVELSKLPKKRAFQYEFKDASVSKLQKRLQYLAIRLPIQLQGTLNGWAWVQNRGSYFSTGDYIAEAEFTSPLIRIDQLILADFKTRLGYSNGQWKLRTFSGRLLPNPNAAPTDAYLTFSGSGIVPADETKKAVLKLSIENFILAKLLEAFGQTGLELSALGDAQMDIEVLRADVADISKWSGIGQLQIRQLKHPTIEQADLTSGLKIAEEKFSLVDAKLTNDKGAVLNFDGSLSLMPPADFTFHAPVQFVELSKLLKPETFEKLSEIQIRGLEAGWTGGGKLSPLDWKFDFNADAEMITASNLSLANTKLIGTVTPTTIGPLRVSTMLGNGEIRGSYAVLDYATDNPKTNAIVDVQNVDLIGVAHLQNVAPVVFSGHGDVSWKGFQPAQPTDLNGQLDGTLQSDILSSPAGPIRIKVNQQAERSFVFEAAVGDAAEYLRADGTLNWEAWTQGSYKATTQFSHLKFDLTKMLDASALPTQLDRNVVATGKANISGALQEKLTDVEFDLNYVLAMYRDAPLGIKELKGKVDSKRVVVDTFKAFLGTKTASGSGEFRLDGKENHRAELLLENWPLKSLLDFVGGPVPQSELDAEVSANLRVSKAADEAITNGWTGAGSAVANNITLKGRDVGNLKILFNSDQERIRAEARGTLLNGEIEAIVRLANKPIKDQPMIVGTATISRMAIDEMMTLWQTPAAARLFQGEASGRVDFVVGEDSGLRGNSELMLTGFRYNGQLLSEQAKLVGTFNDERLIVDSLETPFGAGRIRVNGVARYSDGFVADLQVNLDRIDLSQAISVVDVAYAETYQGRLSGRINPRITAEQVAFRGSLQGQNLRLFEIPFDSANSQISGSYRLASHTTQVHFTRIDGKSLGGDVNGDLDLRWTRCLNMDGRFQIAKGHMSQFEEWFKTGEYFGDGMFDANLSIESDCFKSVNDLNGSLAMKFGATDAKSVPLFGPLSRAVPTIGLPTARFDTGSLNATINGGQMRIQNALLYNPQVWIAAAGSIGLANQTLNIDTTVYTGSINDSQLLTTIITALSSVPDPTIQTITALTNAISNRTVYLSIAGTANSPIVRLNTSRTASRYVVDSFVRQFAGAAILGGAAASAVNDK